MKKIVSFLLITIIILAVIVGIPGYQYVTCKQYIYGASVDENGNQQSRLWNEMLSIFQDETMPVEQKQKVGNLVKDYQTMMQEKSDMQYTLSFILGIGLGIVVIILGIIVTKCNQKLLASSLVTSGTIALICYLVTFWMEIRFRI